MADKLTLNQLRHWIPDLSQYRFTEARRHCLEGGRGAPVLTVPTPRMRVSTAQMDHFRTFITSPHTELTPLSRATLLRILSKCAASVWKWVQGLDYVSAAGAEAFDDLCDVVETLGDVGEGMGWAKQLENNLRVSKRYLSLKATLKWV